MPSTCAGGSYTCPTILPSLLHPPPQHTLFFFSFGRSGLISLSGCSASDHKITSRSCRSCAGHRNQGGRYFTKRCSQQTRLPAFLTAVFLLPRETKLLRRRGQRRRKGGGWGREGGDCSCLTLLRESSPKNARRRIREAAGDFAGFEKKSACTKMCNV